jgi:hypothetical protein
MDSAYDAKPIHEYSRKLGHVPIIDANPRRDAAAQAELQAEEKRGQLLGLETAEEVRFHERTTVERVNARLKRRIRGADGARAGQRQGDVPFDVRRPGADGRPDPATDHIGRAEPLRKQKYYGAQRAPQSRRVEKREFQGLGAGKAQVCIAKYSVRLKLLLRGRIGRGILQEAQVFGFFQAVLRYQCQGLVGFLHLWLVSLNTMKGFVKVSNQILGLGLTSVFDLSVVIHHDVIGFRKRGNLLCFQLQRGCRHLGEYNLVVLAIHRFLDGAPDLPTLNFGNGFLVSSPVHAIANS